MKLLKFFWIKDTNENQMSTSWIERRYQQCFESWKRNLVLLDSQKYEVLRIVSLSSERSSIFSSIAGQRNNWLVQLSRPGHFHYKNNEKLDFIESSEEEEDRMLSRVAFRAGESLLVHYSDSETFKSILLGIQKYWLTKSLHSMLYTSSVIFSL